MLYNMLKKLIERKYYNDKQTIVDLLNNFATFKQITIEQYSELMILVDDKYIIVDEEVENIEDNTEIAEEQIEENSESNEIEENE